MLWRRSKGARGRRRGRRSRCAAHEEVAAVAAVRALLAVVAAAGAWWLWRVIAYGPVDRRVEEWRTADVVRRRAIETELAGLHRPWHIRRLVWHLGDEDDRSGLLRAVRDALLAMPERSIEPLYQAAAVKPRSTTATAGTSSGAGPALRLLPRDIRDVARLWLEGRRRRAQRLPTSSVDTLLAMGPAAKPALRRLADQGDPAVAQPLLEHLYYARGATAHEIRMELLARRGADARPDYVVASGVFAMDSGFRLPALDAAAVQQCVASLGGIDPGSRAYALRVLGAVDSPEAADALAAFLDESGELRLHTAAALALHDDPRALPVLLDMIEPQSSWSRGDGLQALRVSATRGQSAS